MKFPEGASISDLEIKRVADALVALAQDPHAPREMTIQVTLNVHREYPRTVYKGKDSRNVANEAEADKAASEGFGSYDHEAFTAVEEE